MYNIIFFKDRIKNLILSIYMILKIKLKNYNFMNLKKQILLKLIANFKESNQFLIYRIAKKIAH